MERCTENPLNVLTTYDGIHSHPGKQSHSAGESVLPLINARENADSENLASMSTAPITAPITHQDGQLLGPLDLPTLPSNYVSPELFKHMLTNALSEPEK